MLRYSHCPPTSFPKLLGSKAADALKEANTWWHLLGLVDTAIAAGNVKLKEFMRTLPFARATWPREIFVALEEAQFKVVPNDIASEVRDACRAMQSTKITEDCFNTCTDCARHNKSGKLAAQSAFHAVSTSDLLQDNDRVLVPETLASRNEAAIRCNHISLVRSLSCAASTTPFSTCLEQH